MDPITVREFQKDVIDMVRANGGDPAAAAQYLNELVETQVISLEDSHAIWGNVTGLQSESEG